MKHANPLSKYLAEHGLSHAAFAERTGADRVQIWRCATGRRGPGLSLAIRIEKATRGAVPVESWSTKSRPRKAA